jgi:hypothetical protein
VRLPLFFGPTFVRRSAKIAVLGTKVGLSVAVVGLVGLVACSSSGPDVEPPQPGDALEAASGAGPSLTLPPGQEVVVVVSAVRNASGEKLEITKLRALPGAGVPDAVQVVQVSVLTAAPEIPPGTYVTFPPVVRGKTGRCTRAGISSPSGVVVEPGDEPVVLVWLRSVAEGRATVDGFRVTYGQSDTLYEQEVAAEGVADITVDPNAAARKPTPDEQACAHRTRVLPGAVVF